MSQQIGVPQETLDAIELRLIGADHRPWRLATDMLDAHGKPHICKGSRKAHRKAEWANLAWSKNDPIGKLMNAQRVRELDHNKGREIKMEKCGGISSDPPDIIDEAGYLRSVALFSLCDQANNDMGEFVAHAPEDIEILLNEVKSMRARLRRIEDEREDFRKEMLSLRVEKTTLQEKLTTMRRTVRDFAALMKES